MSTPSEISICNSALIKIGCDRIDSFDDGDKAANLCKEQYEKVRDEVLGSHPWNFAKKRIALGRLTATPAFGFNYAYQLPGDCIMPIETDDDSYVFKVEGTTLLSDATAVSLLYITRESDVSKYTPKFCEALSLRLAAELAFPMTNSATLGKAMMDAYMAMMKEARWLNAVEQTADSLQPGDDWINARF